MHAIKILPIGSSQITYGGISACSSIACIVGIYFLKVGITFDIIVYEKLMRAGSLLWKRWVKCGYGLGAQTWKEIKTFNSQMFKNVQILNEYNGFLYKELSTEESENFALYTFDKAIYETTQHIDKPIACICTIGFSSIVLFFTEKYHYIFDSHAPIAKLFVYENIDNLICDIKNKMSYDKNIQFTIVMLSI
jgi:hypothetical protein